MKVQADFTKISTEYEGLPEGEYVTRIESIKEGTSRGSNLPQLEYELVVTEGEKEGRKMTDFVTLKTNKGDRNDIGLGRMKAYHEAVHGQGSATDELDTDDVLGALVRIVVKDESYKKDGETKTGKKIKHVLPV